jgi:hypothetical protein
MKTKSRSKGSLVYVALITLVFALGIQVTPAQPPVLLSASASQDGSTVTAVFNEPVDEVLAEDTFTYFITGSDGSFIDLVSATLAADQQTVTLIPNGTFTAGVSYTLGVVFICDVTFECSDQQSVPISFQQVLIAAGSVWRYLDTGIDPGTAWIDPFFDDTSWAAGPAELGYGDGDEATIINSTVGGSRLITAYFRHTFNVADASAISGLALQLWRDDGAIVYLNGVEVFRNNMPPGPASYSTLASTVAVDDGNVPVEAQLSSGTLVSGANVIAVEVHQNALTSSDITFDLALLTFGGPPPNNPPVANSQMVSVQVNTHVSFTLSGSDPDGDPLTFGIASSPTHGALSGTPPSVTYTPQSGYVGPDSFTFIVNDGIADSAPATVSIDVQPQTAYLVAAGSVWRYLDTGIDPGPAWIDPFYDDSAWAAGPAELGYGDNDEVTVINRMVGGAILLTAYFRHTFIVADASAIPGLALQLRRDDGAIVYLNGVEVFRNNMPPGPASYSTLASSTALDDGNVPVEAQLSSGTLVSGANVIAVEVHQASPASSDITFDLALLPSSAPTNHPPVANSQSFTVLVNTFASIALSGSDPDSDPLTFIITSSPTHGALSGTPPNLTYAPQGGYVGPDSFTFKVNDGTVDSAPATVSINVLPNPPGLVSAAACSSVVTVIFDKALEPLSASDPFNYFILGSNVAAVAVVSATLESDQRTVTLITDPFTPFILGVPYTLVAMGICDTSGDCLSQASVPIQFDFSRPTVTCNVATNTLFPPNDLFIDVGLTATASVGTLELRVFSDEPELFGATDATFDGSVLRLRARRLEEGDGRVYLIVVTATNGCNGNVAVCCKTVVVPHNLSKSARNAVNAQAAAAEAQCSPQGAPSTPYQLLP